MSEEAMDPRSAFKIYAELMETVEEDDSDAGAVLLIGYPSEITMVPLQMFNAEPRIALGLIATLLPHLKSGKPSWVLFSSESWVDDEELRAKHGYPGPLQHGVLQKLADLGLPIPEAAMVVFITPEQETVMMQSFRRVKGQITWLGELEVMEADEHQKFGGEVHDILTAMI